MADDDKRTNEKKTRAKAEQRALVPNAEGNVMVEAIMGPYRGQHLTMTATDGQAAIDAHWARDPTEAIYEHDELDEAERTAALDASHTWAQAQWDAAQGVEPPEPPPPEGGVTRRRALEPEDKPGGYSTRGAPRR